LVIYHRNIYKFCKKANKQEKRHQLFSQIVSEKHFLIKCSATFENKLFSMHTESPTVWIR